MILINATTSMHKSTSITNNFGKTHFGQNYQKQKIQEISEDYNGVCLKKFQRKEQKLENAFLAKFSTFLRISYFQKINYGILFNQEMPLMFLRQLISTVGGKVCKNYSKIDLESTKFESQCIKIGC